eukprot:2965058-Prymnesium_polylepis.3
MDTLCTYANAQRRGVEYGFRAQRVSKCFSVFVGVPQECELVEYVAVGHAVDFHLRGACQSPLE